MIERRRTVFVSGHMDLTPEEFRAHYVPRLHELVQARCVFVCGDAPGCDHMVQRWFADSFPLGGAPLTVYHMLHAPRPHREPYVGPFNSTPMPFPVDVYPLVGGFRSDEERDAAMTGASDEDLAWVRQDRRSRRSGTQANLDRRRRVGAARRRAQRSKWPRHLVDDAGHFDERTATYTLTLTDDVRYGHPVPLDPALVERYHEVRALLQDAQDRWFDVQHDLRAALNEERNDPTTPKEG